MELVLYCQRCKQYIELKNLTSFDCLKNKVYYEDLATGGRLHSFLDTACSFIVARCMNDSIHKNYEGGFRQLTIVIYITDTLKSLIIIYNSPHSSFSVLAMLQNVDIALYLATNYMVRFTSL